MQPVLTSLALQRRGALSIPVTGKSHCGHPSIIADGRVQVEYEVNIRVDDVSALDGRGFIADQEALHEALKEGITVVPAQESCEQLTVQLGQYVLRWLVHHNVNAAAAVSELSFSLRPFPGLGTMTAVFK